MFAETFLRFLLGGDAKFAADAFCKDELLDATGARTTLSEMEGSISGFTGRFMTFIDKNVEPIDCIVEGDYAMVRFNVRWDGLDTLSRRKFSGIARIKMKRSPYEGWDVVQAVVPGWNAVA